MNLQKTLRSKTTFYGKGLHSGRLVRMEVHPADCNSGIVFKRTDINGSRPLLANWKNITSTDLCTTLGRGDFSISTIEHLMAAFVGSGIDNALVKIDGPEIPILDGSSREFMIAFANVGTVEYPATKRQFVIKKTFEVKDGDRHIKITPAIKTSYVCNIDFGNSFIGTQKYVYTSNAFSELSDARTFCHVNEVNALKRMGLAQGGSLENAVVVTDTGVMNTEGLRSDDEFVRHKLLDCIGDLALLGGELIAHIEISRPGHGFHADVMRELMNNKDKFLSIVEPFNKPKKAVDTQVAYA